jgi:hypothetical protein
VAPPWHETCKKPNAQSFSQGEQGLCRIRNETQAKGCGTRVRSLNRVKEVQANPLTGNVLIRFDPRLSADRLLSELRSLPASRATPTNDSTLDADGGSGTAVVAEAAVKGTFGHVAVDVGFYTVTAAGTALGFTWLAPLAAVHLVLDVLVWGAVLHPVAEHFLRRRPAGVTEAQA